jgi:hypothetical protein
VFFVNDHNEGHAHVDQLEASSFGGTHPGRDGRCRKMSELMGEFAKGIKSFKRGLAEEPEAEPR